MATVTTRLDSHDRRIARTEKYQAGENPEGPEPVWTDHESRRDGGGGGGGWFGGGRDDGFTRGRGGPREPKLSFPHYDSETDPLSWLNKCDGFFRGYRTLEEDMVWMASLHLDGVAAQWSADSLQRAGRNQGTPAYRLRGRLLAPILGPPVPLRAPDAAALDRPLHRRPGPAACVGCGDAAPGEPPDGHEPGASV